MREVVQRENQTREGDSTLPARVGKASPHPHMSQNHILRLQRAIGNRAVLRLLRSQRQDALPADMGAAADRDAPEAERHRPRGDYARGVARQGMAEPARTLPHLDAIQRSFGDHDISGVEAHVGERATAANEALGADGYAMGNHVVFAGAPDLRTAAHEAAHVVQQRAGVQLKGGVGQAGDAYERHADAVAERVATGRQADDLLDAASPDGKTGQGGERAARNGAGTPSGGGSTALQRQEATNTVAESVTGGIGAILEYQAMLRDLYNKIDAAVMAEAEYMFSKGKPLDVVAKWAVAARNQAKITVRQWDLLSRVAEERNLQRYGDKVGPSYDQLKSGDPARNIKPKTDAQIIEGAGRANATVNRWSGRLRIAGRIFILIDIGVSTYKVVTAPPQDRPKVFIKEATGLAGALAGGALGAKGGAWVGAGIGTLFFGAGTAPGALIGGIVGGIGGAIGGAWAGSEVGEWLVDELYPVQDTRLEEGQ